jgi:EF-P beta-lysylation protein EpmB
MISATPHRGHPGAAAHSAPSGLPRWRTEMAEAITSPQELLTILGLPSALLSGATAAAATFGLRVPRSYVARMRQGDPHDPLLRQVLPLSEELAPVEGFGADPLGEHAALRAPSLLQKYHGRALLITTPACAVHCRYCFRREFPYADTAGDAPRWSLALAEIAADSSITEVILSGGDPLSLGDERLGELLDRLSAIAHVRRIRLHTRTPVVLPSRVDEGLAHNLRRAGRPLVMVLHSNHPRELDTQVADACARLAAAGAVLLNQTVLLKDVNDDAAVLAELSERLFEVGVLPYYLHLLDRVRGVAHFEVSETDGQRIAGELAALLPGYLVPRLVRETAGAPAKLALAPRF